MTSEGNTAADVVPQQGVVTVSRTVATPAHRVFELLADPSRHPDFDGSGMLRSAPENRPITAVGDVFVMKKFYGDLGEHETEDHVVEFEVDRRIAWEPAARDAGPAAASGVPTGERTGHRWGWELQPDGPGATVVTEIYDCSRAPESVRTQVHEGRAWRRSMETSLERLDATRRDSPPAVGISRRGISTSNLSRE